MMLVSRASVHQIECRQLRSLCLNYRVKNVQTACMLFQRSARTLTLDSMLLLVVADLPRPDKLKAAFQEVAKRHQDRLSRFTADLQKAQASANSTQGQLDACSSDLRLKQEQASALQTKLDRAISQIQNEVLVLLAKGSYKSSFNPHAITALVAFMLSTDDRAVLLLHCLRF